MKRAVITILFIACVSTFAVQAQQPDAVYRLLRRTYTVNSDGSMDITFRKELTLLRNRAITAYADKGETFIVYNPERERLTINESYTLLPDGRKVPTPSNAMLDQLPSSCSSCAHLAHLRERVVVHTALQYGATIVLDYTIHRPDALLSEPLSILEDCPIEKYEVIIDMPQGEHILCATNESAYNRVSFRKERDSHTLHLIATDVPQQTGEPYAPNGHANNALLYLSTVNSPWQMYHIANDNLEEASDLIKYYYANDSLEYANALRDIVANHVALNAVDEYALGPQTVSATNVWRSNCGTAFEKAVLLQAMLTQAGFNARVEFANIPRAELYDHASNSTVTVEIINFRQLQPVVILSLNNADYVMSPVSKAVTTLNGVAIDELRTVESDEQLQYEPKNIGGGIGLVTLPDEAADALGLRADWLTSERTTPLTAHPIKIRHRYNMAMPSGVHLMKSVHIEEHINGVADMSIVIREQNGTVTVERDLTIEQKYISTSAYKTFRKLIAQWESNRKFYIEGL